MEPSTGLVIYEDEFCVACPVCHELLERRKRKKQMAENPLDDIPGIGPSRKKALLAHFGSAKAVRNAALADLEAVDGVSKAMAKRIHDWFQR